MKKNALMNKANLSPSPGRRRAGAGWHDMVMRTIFPLLVFSAFCPACVQECCQFGCHLDYVTEWDTDVGVTYKYLEGEDYCHTETVCSVKECRQVVEDECGKPASEKRWREIDDPSEDVDWDVYAPWDISDGRCGLCSERVSVGFCVEGG